MWGAIFTPKYPKGTRLYPKEDSEDYAFVDDAKIENYDWKYKICFGNSEEWLSEKELLEKYNIEPNDAKLRKWAEENGWIYKKELE